jgi:hypothetical protein
MWEAWVAWADTPFVVTRWGVFFCGGWLIWFIYSMVTGVTSRLDIIARILENRFDRLESTRSLEGIVDRLDASLDILRRFETREFYSDLREPP